MGQTGIIAVAKALRCGSLTSQELVERCLTAIADPDGEGATTFITVNATAAIASARAYDSLRSAGVTLPAFAGIPISIKDLFDQAGEVTRAGSLIYQENEPALRDAEVVARLRRAGFIPIGRTNMTEFAFSGLGLNPHYGTPASAWDRANRRIPGGSSSGAAISVTDGMAVAAIGTDTGGSCRIPAALNRLAGFKPTARRVPMTGLVPLSPTLDSVGPIAPTVSCCQVLDAVMAGDAMPVDQSIPPVHGLRIAAIQNYVTDDLDPIVADAVAQGIDRLSAAGAQVVPIRLAALERLPQINAMGGFAAAESMAEHRHLLAVKGELYDPRVRARIERGGLQGAADYLDLLKARSAFIAEIEIALQDFDAMAMPTVPILPPPISDLADDARYSAVNLLALRNPSIVNMFDGCAISLPLGPVGSAPVGLSLGAPGGRDSSLLRVALALEPILAQ